MAEIRWTNEAEVWLKDIYDYIALDNSATAAKVVEEIYEKAQIIATFPEVGYKYRSEIPGMFAFFYTGITALHI